MHKVPQERQNCEFDPSWREFSIKSSRTCHVLELKWGVGPCLAITKNIKKIKKITI